MNRPPVETAIANLHLDLTMAASDYIGDVRGVDLEVALEEITRLRDEIDSLHQSLDDARTDWHNLAADRDQARQIARDITRGATRLHDTLRITHQSTAALINPEHHTPDRIRRHLAERGWTHVRDTAIGTDWTHGNPVTHWASVPNATHYVDYARRIAEIVGDLADVHQTGELRILADIEGINGDPLPDWLTQTPSKES